MLKSLPKDIRRRIAREALSHALADNEIHPDEKKLIEELLNVKLDGAEGIKKPAVTVNSAGLSAARYMSAILFMALEIIEADGQVDVDERKQLIKLLAQVIRFFVSYIFKCYLLSVYKS